MEKWENKLEKKIKILTAIRNVLYVIIVLNIILLINWGLKLWVSI